MFSEKKLKLSESDSKVSCENEIKCVTDKFHALQNSIEKGDSIQAQKIIITIIEIITIMIEIIEYRITTIGKTKNAAEREKLSKALQTELIFITDHITLLRDCTAKPTLLNQQLLNLVTESINRIETQVGNVEKVRQAEVDKVKNQELVAETQPTMQEEPSNILPKETKPSFNLPIPEHANDFLEVIESGGFSLEDEDEDEIVPEVTTSVIESVLKPEEKLELLDKSKNEIKNIEEDWVNVQKLLNKRMTVGQTSKPFKMSDCAKELKVVSEKLNSLPATVKKGDSTVIQKTIITIIEHITVWLEIIEQRVILINNTKNPQEKARLSKFVQDQLVNVTQQLTVLKQTTSTITILRQEVITTVNWCLQSVENQILSIKHSHEQSTEKQIEKPENKSANIEKSKEVAVHEVKSEKDKPKPATFNLPIPDHANDFMDIIDGGGFSLDSEDEEIDNELPMENKSANIEKSRENVVHEVKNEKDKPKPASFNLPIPEHVNDFMEIIDGGGFSLDSEDEEEECALPMKNKSANIEKSKENPEEKLELLDKSKKEQNVSFKNLEEDWVNV